MEITVKKTKSSKNIKQYKIGNTRKYLITRETFKEKSLLEYTVGTRMQ